MLGTENRAKKKGAASNATPKSMQEEASLKMIKAKGKVKNVSIANTKEVQMQGYFMISIWIFTVFVLWVFSNPEATAKVFDENPRLPTMYGATAVAFAFATALDVLAYTNAVSDEKRVLSGVLAYVDGVACISYLAMATLPLYFLSDSHNQNPVWLMRYAEWLITCPTLLYWCGLATRGERGAVSDIATGDAMLLAGGALSSVLPGWPSFFVFVGSCLAFTYVMTHMWNLFGKAMQPDFQPAPPLPSHALNLMRWEIVLSWTCFPIVEYARRYFGMSYTTGEALNCSIDYAAKVGLAMIMVNCNLEQINSIKVQQMQSAMSGMVKIMRKTNIATSALKQLDGMDEDVQGWLMNEYAGAQDQDDSKKKKKEKLKTINPSKIASSTLFSWDFDSLEKKEEDLVGICIRVFKELQMTEIFDIDDRKLQNFIYAVRARYNKNPFHNWKHAVMVLHSSYLFITQVAIEFCNDLEILAMLIAALCHDSEHNGMNNAFHINSRSDLALRYNDQSVLENHHCFTAFDILLEKENNILSGLSSQDFKRVRALVIDCILGTDMAAHATKLSRLEDINRLGGFSDLADNEDQRSFILVTLLHTADLYNPIKPFHINKRWASRLQKEFNQQVKVESSMGLPSLPFMKGEGELALAKGEVGFITFVIKPWYQQLCAAFPKIEFLMDNIDTNLDMWKAIVESHENR